MTEAMPARLLVDLFIDKHSWVPFMDDLATDDRYADPAHSGDGVICGMGRMDGRKVCLYVQDMSVHFGTIGKRHGSKVAALIDLAIQNRCPLIGIVQTGGARIQEGPVSLSAATLIADKLIAASGYIPTVAIVNGPAAGGGAYMSALSDFCIMNERGTSMFLTGPKAIRRVLNETITGQDLGGIEVHDRKTGLATFRARHIADARTLTARLLTFLPDWWGEGPASGPVSSGSGDDRPALNTLLPVRSGQPYDMEAVLRELLDEDSALPLCAGFAPNVLTWFGRIGGMPLGVVANQPAVMGGVLDMDSTKKIARFVQICDAYRIPLLFAVDCPGYLPGRDQEWNNVIGKGSLMTHVISAATVPRVTLLVRRAIGGAFGTLNSLALGGDFCLAWVHAEISVVGMNVAQDIVRGNGKGNGTGGDVNNDSESYLNPWFAASQGLIDKVIEPGESRRKLIGVYRMLLSRKGKTGLQKKRGILPMG